MASDDDSIFRMLTEVALNEPVLVVGLDGWVDAGLGASAAMATLVEATNAEPIAVFDSDLFVDQRARRPIAHIVNGVT